MPYLSMNTPLGTPITVFEWSGSVAAIEWGRAPDGESTPALERARAQIDDYFAGRRTRFDFPLAPVGTPFQKRVWAELSTIPFGTLVTYGDIARALKTAPRAVGRACAANPLPIVVPCHRVVGASGAMTGYSGLDGIETKKLLLRLEGLDIA